MSGWRTEYKILALLGCVFFSFFLFFFIKGNYASKIDRSIREKRLSKCSEATFTKGIEYTTYTCTIQDELGHQYTIEYPQLKEETKEIKAINRNLKKVFDEVYKSIEYYDSNQKLEFASYQKVNFKVYHSSGVVSFLVEKQDLIGTIRNTVNQYTIYNFDDTTYELLDSLKLKKKLGIDRDYASSLKGMIVKMYLDEFRYDYNNELDVYRNTLIDESIAKITYPAINNIYIDDEGCSHFIIYLYNQNFGEEVPYNFTRNALGNTTYEILQ